MSANVPMFRRCKAHTAQFIPGCQKLGLLHFRQHQVLGMGDTHFAKTHGVGKFGHRVHLIGPPR